MNCLSSMAFSDDLLIHSLSAKKKVTDTTFLKISSFRRISFYFKSPAYLLGFYVLALRQLRTQDDRLGVTRPSIAPRSGHAIVYEYPVHPE